MELQNKIAVKHQLRDLELARGLKHNSPTYNESIQELSARTGLSVAFLEMNIQTIRNWIDL